MIKKSIIFKLFIQTIVIFTLIFLIQFLFQTFIFPDFFISNKTKEINEEMGTLVTSLSEDNLHSYLLDFSTKTQTTTELIPLDDLEDTIIEDSFYKITVRTLLLNTYTIYAPEIYSDYYVVGNTLSGRVYKIEDSNDFVPAALVINNQRLIYPYESSDILKLFDIQVDISENYNLAGRIIQVDEPTISTSLEYSPIITNEVLNIATNNVTKASNTSYGYYYTSVDKDGKDSNLVFVGTTTVGDIDYAAISVYNLQQVSDIASSIQNISIYIFLFAFIILTIVSYFYSKNISKPIIQMGKKTKQMSDMIFTNELIETKREDELGDLAKNIDVLAINLKTALDTLKDQNNQLSQVMDRENKNESLRKSFVSGISHELKTPLAVIQASSEAISSGIFSTKEEINEQLKLIQQEVTKTSKLIVDMVNVYNLDVVDFQDSFKSFDLNEVVLNSIHSLENLAKTRNLSIQYQVGQYTAFGDNSKIEMVFNNLITNAIKYTPKNNTIIIKIFEENKVYKIVVINTGASIPNEDIEKVFEPFYRVDKSRSRIKGSTGIGLYIVSQILKQHNSMFSFKNIDEGVQFTFTLHKPEALESNII